MKMPNSDQSSVAWEKITDYLLSSTHVSGKDKALFFSTFGFNTREIDVFRNALMQHSVVRDVASEQTAPFGTKYKLVCEIQKPDERNPCIVSVWILDTGTNVPKLITAYPD